MEETEMDEQNTINETMDMLHAEMDKILLSFPMWMRFNYLCNTVNGFLNQDHTDADINWDKVNEILTTNVNEYDFNAFKRIDTSDRLVWEAARCRSASVCDDIWQEHICKDCGKEFIMTYNEVHFYENKNLHIPKRCKACREKRKAGNAK